MFTCPDVLIQLPSGPFSFTHTHIHTHTGSLDRCVEGETAQTILNNSPLSSPAPSSSSSSSTPLQVCSLRAGEKDPMIQVLLFDPQSLITRLTKMEVEKVPKQRKPKQVDAFKTYLYARRHFGSGELCLHRTIQISLVPLLFCLTLLQVTQSTAAYTPIRLRSYCLAVRSKC